MYDAAATVYTTSGRTRAAGTQTPRRAASSAAQARGGRERTAAGPRPGEIALLIAVTVVIVAITLLAGLSSRRQATTGTHLVRVGVDETLWSLAESNSVPGQDTAATVDQIRVLNSLSTSALAQGATLRVPAIEAPDTSYASR